MCDCDLKQAVAETIGEVVGGVITCIFLFVLIGGVALAATRAVDKYTAIHPFLFLLAFFFVFFTGVEIINSVVEQRRRKERQEHPDGA